jgi:HSP20 family molecular chaperone IbpA
MRAGRLELMRDHVRAIHRSVTGRELPDPTDPEDLRAPGYDEVMRRFAALEAMARTTGFAERVAPFSFTPPLDVMGTEREIVIELGVPGIERGDVEVEMAERDLTIQGARNPTHDGKIYFHAEMARGPFRRVVRLPEPTSGAVRIETENGIVRIRLVRAARSPLPRA